MRRARRPLRVACLVVALAAACATNTAPAGFLLPPRDAQASAHGGWMELTLHGDPKPRRVAGELLAVTADSVWVLTKDGAVVVATAGVIRGKLTAYRSSEGAAASWTALGVLSTASNGILLIFTAPAWIITGTVAASGESRTSQRRAPPLAWHELAAFARFPQGLPRDLPLESLTPKK